MSTYSWAITVDKIESNAVGTMGPSDAPIETAAEVIAHPDRQAFKMFDDDGELYYQGFYVGDDSEDILGPLDDFGTPNAGCSEIHYKNKAGKFEMV